MINPFESCTSLIRNAVANGQIPSAALAVGVKDQIYVKETFGTVSILPDAASVNETTLYDMASVSKMLSTTMIALRLIEHGVLDLADMLPRYFGDRVPDDKKGITVFQLLTHTSGIPAHFFLEEVLPAGADPTDAILQYPLAYQPGTQVVYSCMGFILLGKLMETAAGSSLDQLAQDEVFGPLGMTSTGYHPLNQLIDSFNTAYTEKNHLTGDWLCGQVHDENAYFLNGIAGNAGIFSNLNDCIRFAQMLAGHGTLEGNVWLPRCIFDTAIQNYTPGMDENRGLGFHLACGHFSYSGQFFDQNGFGHNGFTGPHIFVSPTTGLYVILLTNRVHPTRANSSHLRLRRLLHTQAAIGYEKLTASPNLKWI